ILGSRRTITQAGVTPARTRGLARPHCPDICPTTLAVVAAAMRALADQAEQVQPIFVSLDPDRDTPERLGDYVRYFHPEMIGLTGSAEALAETADRYKVRYAFVGKGEREHYSLDHTASVYVIDRQGQLARIIPYGLPPEVIVDAVRAQLSADEGAQTAPGAGS
ncbi:SCO family protein, partial [Thiorhodococcus minor]